MTALQQSPRKIGAERGLQLADIIAIEKLGLQLLPKLPRKGLLKVVKTIFIRRQVQRARSPQLHVDPRGVLKFRRKPLVQGDSALGVPDHRTRDARAHRRE